MKHSLFALIWADTKAFVHNWEPHSPRSIKFWRLLLRNVLSHRAFGAVLWYRYGHWAFCDCKLPLWSHLHRVLYFLFVPFNRAFTGAEILYSAEIGPGLCMVHGQQVIGGIKAGANLYVHDGVLIGQRHDRAPILGDNVLLGARAIVIGEVHLGDNSKIGAGAVVVKDVPAGATAVGNPARIVRKSSHPSDASEHRLAK